MVDLRVVIVSVALAAACGGPGTSAPPPRSPAAPAAEQPALRSIATVDTQQGAKVAVYASALYDGTPCWTFVTAGLAAKQHPELVLSLAMRKGEVAGRYPSAAVELLGELAAALPARTRLDPWQSLTLPSGMLGRADLIGVAAVPAIGPAGLKPPPGAVTLLLLTAEETDVARDHGAARVAAMIGHHYRFYPTAWWNDRDRPSLVTRAQLATSALAGSTGIRVAGLTTVFELAAAPEVAKALDKPGLPEATTRLDGMLHVRVAPEAAPDLARALRGLTPDRVALALLKPDPLAGGRFVWVPGETSPQVITGPGFTGRVTGSFLAIGLDPSATRAVLVEDGAVLTLTPAVRDAVAQALDGRRAYGPTSAAGSLPWIVEVTRPMGSGPLVEVTLLTPEDQLAGRVSVSDLAAFLHAVEREVVGAVQAVRPTAATARVHLTLRPGGRTVRIEPVSDDRGPWVDDLRRRIERLPAVVVTGEVSLRATFSLTAAAAAPDQSP
jgi:hypothetical protein